MDGESPSEVTSTAASIAATLFAGKRRRHKYRKARHSLAHSPIILARSASFISKTGSAGRADRRQQRADIARAGRDAATADRRQWRHVVEQAGRSDRCCGRSGKQGGIEDIAEIFGQDRPDDAFDRRLTERSANSSEKNPITPTLLNDNVTLDSPALLTGIGMPSPSHAAAKSPLAERIGSLIDETPSKETFMPRRANWL